MGIERAPGGSSLIDVLDRVLDKGIVIDAWVRVSLVGIELVTVEARVVVASIVTYFAHSEALAELPTSVETRDVPRGRALHSFLGVGRSYDGSGSVMRFTGRC